MSIQTRIYFNFLNSAKWVISICQIWLGIRPPWLTPKWGTGDNVRQLGHCSTITLASSLVILCQSLKVWLEKWNLLWSILANATGSETKASPIKALSMRSLPITKGPGRPEWAHIWLI